MDKRKVVSLALVLAMGTGLLTGCGTVTNADVAENTQSVVETIVNRVDNFEELPEVRKYEPGEHVFMIRYNLLEELGYSSANSITSTSIPIPDGYEILDVENYNELGSKVGTSQTYGVDVWYINSKTVEVSPVYNEAFKFYDYSQPGKVVEPILGEDNSLGK